MIQFVEKYFTVSFEEFIKKHQFIEKEKKHSEENFGNAYVVLENDSLALRIVKDRSQCFIDIRSSKEEGWHQLFAVIEFLNLSKRKILSLEEQLNLLKEYYERINAIFRSDSELKKFSKFEVERNRLQMNKIFNKGS